MPTYVYRDKNFTPPKEVFRCEAKDILEADRQYKESVGKDPAKQPHVGCESGP
jgi:hypothetical protein